MSFGYDEVSQLQTRIAILESQVDVKSVTIEQLKSENEQLTNLVNALLKKDKWDGSAIEPTYLPRVQPKKWRNGYENIILNIDVHTYSISSIRL